MLNSYIANKFVKRENINNDDENFIMTWQNWLKNFNPSEIINNFICSRMPVNFIDEKNIIIEIYSSFAGRIPVIIFENAQDFENFITNLFYKGARPENLSQMGASFIYGQKQRFLTLSKKFYSSTEPDYLNLSPEEWRDKSMIIRREHELTDYYTKKFYGSASNNLHDELIADFTGIYAAFNSYSAKIFCHFMGIDGTHAGRFSLYTEELNNTEINELAKIAVKCANNLENWTHTPEFVRMSTQERINFLCELGIKGICELV